MIRKIIKIDEETCNGCGLCAKACHEGAIGMVNGKAKLLRDDYCPGTQSKTIHRENECEAVHSNISENKSQLSQWPVQIKLAPVNAPYFANANLLIAADCTAYAYGDFHNRRLAFAK